VSLAGAAAPRRSLTVAVLALACASGFAQQAAYVKRLSLPVAGNDIAYGHCVTVDLHTGEIFVCDPRTNRILVFDENGSFDFQIVGGNDLVGPQDVAVDPDGLLLVLAQVGERPLPVELDFDGRFRREVPLLGLPSGTEAPRLVSLALSPGGDRLYATDAANARLWIADRDGLVLSGVDLFDPSDEAAQRNFAVGHVDVYGERVVVALPAYGEVAVFTLDGERLGAVGHLGSAGCQLGRPTAAAVDRAGDLLVLDSQRMIVARWRLAGNRCLSEHIGLGDRPGYLFFPYDLALATNGRFLVAQSADGRVQMFEGLGAAPPPVVAD